MSYSAPSDLAQALDARAEGGWRILGGGTDIYPALSAGGAPGRLLDVTRIADLRGIAETAEGWRIGAATAWSAIARAALPPAFDGLRAAARTVGAVQIQNTGTIAGNLCNASPAADGIPALMALGAEVELASLRGTRRLAVEAFVLGPRRTALEGDEIVTAVHVPAPPPGARGVFLKLGARAYQIISIAMVSAVAWPGPDGRIAGVRLAIGACSPVARRLPGLEAALAGAAPGEMAARVSREHIMPLAPIDDVRGTAGYRLVAVEEMLTRALAQLAEAMR